MDKSNKHDVLIAKVNEMKTGQFKATALKVELEAQFDRDASDDDDECSSCDDSGTVWCRYCAGDGYNIEQGERVTCPTCDGEQEITCLDCHGESRDETDFQSEEYCEQWILERLAPLGLAKQQYGEWVESGPLIFSKFYNDHSVDSEYTFTLSIEDPESVFLLPKILEVFVELGKTIDRGFDVSGAGMHMAVLNNPDCYYEDGQRPEITQKRRFTNFRRSMQLLLPALYFLGSTNDRSRGLEYRKPQVECGDDDSRGYDFYDRNKYSAISYRNTALEFRIFETCYDTPEAILDNVVVMANCLRYWRSTYRNPGLDRITKVVRFGRDGGRNLDRFYATTEHVDLLNEGLKKLKPSYYTIRQLKQQRNFTVDKRKVGNAVNAAKKKAALGYKEYVDRFEWNLRVTRHSLLYERLDGQQYSNPRGVAEDPDSIEARIALDVDEAIEARRAGLQPLEEYVEANVRGFEGSLLGQFTLGEA